MRKYLIHILLPLFAAFAAVNVEAADTKDKTMCFVYIAESDLTDNAAVANYLDLRYRKALSDKNFLLVIYLASEDNPLVVEINTPDDNRGDYPELLAEVKSVHINKVYPDSDLQRLVALFEKLEMFSQSYDIMYDSVDWHFHVTSDFWKQGYNESLISSLCFVMGVDHFENTNFRLRCYFSRYDDFEYDEAYPFGKKNYCNLEFRPYYY